jgi:hypothetical protein
MNLDIAKIGPWIGGAVGVVTVMGSIAGAFLYLGRLDARLTGVENQIHLLVVAPTLANGNGSGVAPNPIAKACADLAQRAADNVGVNLADELEIREIMKEMGCLAPL